MIKSKREQILELLNTLYEGINYIKFNIDTEYYFMSEIALEAVNLIEKILEKSQRAQIELDRLIKSINKDINKLQYRKINNNAIKICDRVINNLQKSIDIVENRIKEKINVVFMPYNASMWNSLESVWKEAIKDENCNCYVVPIPYYKLVEKKDGRVKKIFAYEYNMFPDYVKVINYKQFDVKKIKPDIIYIHNQYDECNNVTRVDSNYYSYNLKKHTNHLVYITYGILGTYPVSFYKNFYSFISTRNFDKVIVQSQAFKSIAEYSGVDSKKIIPLGSPKFDSLINSLNQKESNEDLIDKFKNKTVFLWTTNLMKIINRRYFALDEIEELFDTIKNNNDYALIYRPHPLEMMYVKSKAPECFNRYTELLDSLSQYNNIIVDKNPSYYESFKISDALITDRSSVLIEYMATGKPVLIYDIDLKREYYNNKVFDIFSNYIVGEDGMTVDKFIDLVINKKDINKEKRLNALETVINNRDGSCGKKIYQQIKNDVMNNYF